MMRAISLWRPWPWMFFHANKRVENRSWSPPKSIIGEWVAMHATLKFDNDAVNSARRGRFGPKASMVEPAADRHPTGIVGAFFVRGGFELAPGESIWNHAVGAMSESFAALEPEEVSVSRCIGPLLTAEVAVLSRSVYAFGPWCWVTSRVIELPGPIPCKGRQGLWTVPADAERIVRATIERRAA